LIRKRHDGDVGDGRRLDDPALDEAAEVDDDGCAFERCDDVGEGLSGLQHEDAIGGERLLVDVGGAGVEVVGDQGRAGMIGVADGVGGLTLPSFDRVEEYGHSAIVKG
jgi:hypothetical protein